MRYVCVLATILVTVLGTTGCSGKNRKKMSMERTHRVSDKNKKNKNGKNKEGADQKTGGSDEKISTKKGCLDVEQIVGSLKDQPDRPALTYSSDYQLGSIEEKDKKLSFEPAVNERMIVAYFLMRDRKPGMDPMVAGELPNSTLKRYLSVKQDDVDECNELTLNGDGRKTFKIKEHTANSLFARARDGEAIRYILDEENDSLIIENFKRAENGTLCGDKVPAYEKVGYTISWGKGLSTVSLPKDYATLIDRYYSEIPELKQSDRNNYVEIDDTTYYVALKRISEENPKDFECK